MIGKPGGHYGISVRAQAAGIYGAEKQAHHSGGAGGDQQFRSGYYGAARPLCGRPAAGAVSHQKAVPPPYHSPRRGAAAPVPPEAGGHRALWPEILFVLPLRHLFRDPGVSPLPVPSKDAILYRKNTPP